MPQSSTFEQQKDIMVFTIDKDNKVKPNILKVQGTVGNLYVVESGLKEGDKLILSGIGKLRGGMEITPQDTSFDEAIKPIKALFKN